MNSFGQYRDQHRDAWPIRTLMDAAKYYRYDQGLFMPSYEFRRFMDRYLPQEATVLVDSAISSYVPRKTRIVNTPDWDTIARAIQSRDFEVLKAAGITHIICRLGGSAIPPEFIKDHTIIIGQGRFHHRWLYLAGLQETSPSDPAPIASFGNTFDMTKLTLVSDCWRFGSLLRIEIEGLPRRQLEENIILHLKLLGSDDQITWQGKCQMANTDSWPVGYLQRICWDAYIPKHLSSESYHWTLEWLSTQPPCALSFLSFAP